MTRLTLKMHQATGILITLRQDDLKGGKATLQQLEEANYNRMLALCRRHGKGNLGCCQFPLNWWSYTP